MPKDGPSGKRKQSDKEAMSEEARRSRNRILDAAEQVFSQKGFDGARVDEIAETAEVNKALIYYYFEGKKQLLEALVARAMDAMLAEKERDFASLDLKLPITDELIRRGLELTGRGLPIYGTLFAEAFKHNDELPALFKLTDSYLESTFSLLSQKQRLSLPPIEEWRLSAFFFALAPMIVFQLLQDKWAEYYGIGKDALQDQFFNSFSNFYRQWVTSLIENPK